MATYYNKISNLSRAKGGNSLATYSYITGEKTKDEQLDKTYNYSRNERVVFYETIIPEEANSKFKDGNILFNELEKFEKTNNARLAKKIIVNLPYEFNLEEQIQVLRDYIKNNITNLNYACTVAIHHDKANKNPHAHILIANRQIGKDGEFQKIKSKKVYALDEQGQKIPIIDANTGLQKLGARNTKQWKRISVQTNPLDTKEVHQQLLSGWAEACNKLLEPTKHISHKSYKEQGINKIAQKHEGYIEHNKAKRGEYSEVIAYNQEVKAINETKEELQHIQQQLVDLQQEKTNILLGKTEALNNGQSRTTAAAQSAGRTIDTKRTTRARLSESTETDIRIARIRNKHLEDTRRKQEAEERERRTQKPARAVQREEQKVSVKQSTTGTRTSTNAQEPTTNSRSNSKASERSRNSRTNQQDFDIGM